MMKSIPSAPGYFATEDGQIFSTRMSRGKEPRAMRQTMGTRGYLVVGIFKDKKAIQRYVHQLILEAFVSAKPSPAHVVRHIDGDRLNNRLENLRWGTPKENADDRASHGTTQMGEDHYASKLTEDDVRKVRAMYKSGDYSVSELARMYGMSGFAMGCVVGRGNARKTWKHVV